MCAANQLKIDFILEMILPQMYSPAPIEHHITHACYIGTFLYCHQRCRLRRIFGGANPSLLIKKTSFKPNLLIKKACLAFQHRLALTIYCKFAKKLKIYCKFADKPNVRGCGTPLLHLPYGYASDCPHLIFCTFA